MFDRFFVARTREIARTQRSRVIGKKNNRAFSSVERSAVGRNRAPDKQTTRPPSADPKATSHNGAGRCTLRAVRSLAKRHVLFTALSGGAHTDERNSRTRARTHACDNVRA